MNDNYMVVYIEYELLDNINNKIITIWFQSMKIVGDDRKFLIILMSHDKAMNQILSKYIFLQYLLLFFSSMVILPPLKFFSGYVPSVTYFKIMFFIVNNRDKSCILYVMIKILFHLTLYNESRRVKILLAYKSMTKVCYN